MSQTAYPINQPIAFSGLRADIRDITVLTGQAIEEIALGRGVVKVYGSDYQVRLPKTNKSVITDDAGTFTAGSIVSIVNGVTVTTAWASDKNTTMTAHAAAIAALASVLSAVHSTTGHTITVISKNDDLVITTSVAGVTGTMTISSIVVSTNDSDLMGISLADSAREQALVTGVASYKATEAVSVVTVGALYVLVDVAVTADDTVYCRATVNGTKLPGMFGNVSDSGKCFAVTGAKFRTSADAGAFAVLDISRP